MEIRYKMISPDAKCPYRATIGSAGWDLYAVGEPQCWYDKLGFAHIRYFTGLAVEIPAGYFGMFACRSSVSRMDLHLCYGQGIIDSDYRGELSLEFLCRKQFDAEAFTNNPNYAAPASFDYIRRHATIYNVGDRIGQLLIVPYMVDVQFVKSNELSDTDRGSGGYGSTGV